MNNGKAKKIFNTIVDVLVVMVLIVSILVVILSLTTKKSGVPNLFGYAPFTVLTDSMEGTFNEGDLIISKVTNDIGAVYEEGDVITFHIEINDISTYNTHRIVKVEPDLENDIVYYQTKGDNPEYPVDEELQTADNIVAVWTGVRVPVLGDVIGFLRKPIGFFFCVLLPMILFFVYETIRVVMNIIAYNKEKAIEEAKSAVQNAELSEEQKQKAIEEYLASIGKKPDLENESSVQTPAQDNTTESE
jgi:signal peptidase